MSDTMDEVMAELERRPAAPVYLFVGDEFLVRKGADELVKRLLPDASAGLNHFVMDGASPREVAQELSTLPMFPGRKVVLLRDPEFLASRKGKADGLSRAREAWKAGRRKEGARRVLAVAAQAGWGAAELDPSAPGAPGVAAWKEELNVELAEADLEFLREVAVYCREERVTAPEGDVTPLCAELERGLPPGHTLVLAGKDMDARSPLYKLAKEKGRLVDRKLADKHKELNLSEFTSSVLKPLGKRLGRGADQLLKDRVGGNMRLLQSELEKLAAYANGPVIEAADVELLVGRAREEEFFDLMEAIQGRNLPMALRYVEDALSHGSHGLMIVGAIASVLRGLLENHGRLTRLGCHGRIPRTFNQFKADLFPEIEREPRGPKGRAPNPYAVWMGMKAAEGFGADALLDALVACADADLELKSGADGKFPKEFSPDRVILERLLVNVLGRGNG